MASKDTRINFAIMWQNIARYRANAARYAYGRSEFFDAEMSQRGTAVAYEMMTFYLNRVQGSGEDDKRP